MFTGIVEEVGHLRSLRLGDESAVLEVGAAVILEGTRVGDSIATAGVCLTVTEVGREAFKADAVPETVRLTTLAAMRPGAALNLERSVAFGARLGGHLVQGHVDGVGRIVTVDQDRTAVVLTVEAPPPVVATSVEKGSIAIDGVSLTIVAVDGLRLRASLIPHTWRFTTLGGSAPGDEVNLEADIIGKYVHSFLARRQPGGGLTWEKLSEAGFL